jgi:hypothetical protein
MKKSAKAYPRVLSELNYRKAAFLKVTEKKHGHLVWLLAFQKQKYLKSRTKYTLKNNIISTKLARESFRMHCHQWQKLKLLLGKIQFAQLNLCI